MSINPISKGRYHQSKLALIIAASLSVTVVAADEKVTKKVTRKKSTLKSHLEKITWSFAFFYHSDFFSRSFRSNNNTTKSGAQQKSAGNKSSVFFRR